MLPPQPIAPCGPDPEVRAAGVLAYTSAGFDEVYVSQVGPDVEGFFESYGGTVLPRLREATA